MKTEHPRRLRVLLSALNLEHNYALALAYLKGYARLDPVIAERVAFTRLELPVTLHTVETAARLAARRPHVIGFSCNLWNIKRTLKVTALLRRLLPEVVIVLGGQEVTNSSTDYLALHPWLNIIVDGEGEAAFRDILRWRLGELPGGLAAIRGIRYRDGDVVRVNEPAVPISDLDSIPSPYLSNEVRIHPKAHLGMMVETSRGCRAACSFCFEGMKYRKVRNFSLERVEKEIAHMASKGVRHYHILDPILANAEVDRLRELHRIIETHIVPIGSYNLSVEIHAELIRPDTIEYLKHYTLFDIGLQSVTPEALKLMRRPWRMEDFTRGVKLLKTLKGQKNVYIIMGLPGEDFYQYLESVRFAIDLDVERLFVNHLCVLNGTDFRRRASALHLNFSRQAPYLLNSSGTFSGMQVDLGRVYGESIMREHDAVVYRPKSWMEAVP